MTRIRKLTKLIREGKYAAEVLVEFRYDESWSPSMSMDDARKLEAVHLALHRGDIAEAAKYGVEVETAEVVTVHQASLSAV